MVSLKLAVKNIIRNMKYSLGLFLVYLVVSVLFVSLFLFSDMSGNAYSGMLAKQISSCCVQISFSYESDGMTAGDISESDYAALYDINGVDEVISLKYCLNVPVFSLNGGINIYESSYIYAFEDMLMPQEYITEFYALYPDEQLYIAGGEASGGNECVVTESFISITGADSAEDLIGQPIKCNSGWKDITSDMVIAGVLNSDLCNISALENAYDLLIFTDKENIAQNAYLNVYYLYADYSRLDAVYYAVKDLNIEHGTVSVNNTSYAMEKLSQTSEFVSAILALISILCFAAGISVTAGTALLKFSKSRNFYYAAFASGLSKPELTLCFLLEFIIIAIASFILALPIGVLLVKAFGSYIALYVGISFPVTISLSVALYSIVPLAAAGLIPAAVVRYKISFEDFS